MTTMYENDPDWLLADEAWNDLRDPLEDPRVAERAAEDPDFARALVEAEVSLELVRRGELVEQTARPSPRFLLPALAAAVLIGLVLAWRGDTGQEAEQGSGQPVLPAQTAALPAAETFYRFRISSTERQHGRVQRSELRGGGGAPSQFLTRSSLERRPQHAIQTTYLNPPRQDRPMQVRHIR